LFSLYNFSSHIFFLALSMMTRVFFFLARPPSLPFIIFYTTISESIFFFLISYSFLSLYCIFFGSSILTWLSFHPLNVFFFFDFIPFICFFCFNFLFSKIHQNNNYKQKS
jgi:hypothetical protein